MNNLINENSSEENKQYNIYFFTILSLATGLRLFHYFYNRSLWMDEVYLSSSFFHMTYTELATHVLDYQQKAPIGFLWLVKLSVNLFGYNEMSLRLIPLLAGILSVFYFVRVCKYFLSPWSQLLALCIFAFAPAFIYHSTEIKQYSIECLATVMSLSLFIRYKDDQSWKAKILLGIMGGIILWFSFSVIFVLAGIAVGVSLNYIFRKEWKSFFINALPFCMWLISFLLNYVLFTHKHAESSWVVYFFKTYDNFMPLPPHSIQQLKWFPRNFYEMMDYPLGMTWNSKYSSNDLVKVITIPFIPIIFLISGISRLYKKNKEDFYALIVPILFMLTASGLSFYPLIERFWVFIAPLFILFIAMGFEYYQRKVKSVKFKWLLPFLILGSPVSESIYFAIQPQFFYKHKKSFEREGLTYINNNFRDGDAVYNYWNNAPGYKVYKNILNLKYKAIEGHDFRKSSADLTEYNKNLKTDLNPISGKKRIWLIYNKQFLTDIGDLVDDPKWYYTDQFSPINNLLIQFNQLGKPVKTFIRADLIIYLFELN
jgi:hypothetical protein